MMCKYKKQSHAILVNPFGFVQDFSNKKTPTWLAFACFPFHSIENTNYVGVFSHIPLSAECCLPDKFTENASHIGVFMVDVFDFLNETIR